MFFKVISLVFSFFIGTIYIVGFFYDSVFLEEFGISYYEFLGSPLDYLAIGGVFLLTSYANNLAWLIIVLGILGTAYVPFKRHVKKEKIEKYIDIENIPYFVFSLLPILFLFTLTVIPDAKKLASDVKENVNDTICLENQLDCYQGAVLRYRDSKIIFYNSKTKKTNVYTDKRVISVEHGE